MKKQYYLFWILFLLPVSAKSAVTILDSNVDDFPQVTTKFFLLDNENKVVTNVNATGGAIRFYDNNVQLNINNFKQAQANTEKSSVIVAFDLAIGQRTNSFDDFSYAQEVLNEYLSYINEDLTELALLSFSQIPSVESDFTYAINDVENLVSNLQQLANSNIYRSFTTSSTGSFSFFETSQNPTKSILLVTQGLINSDETELIIAKAKQDGIIINVLYISSIVPSNVRRIAIETGGFCVNADDLNELRLPYLATLAKLSEGYKPYEITVAINDVCEESHLFSIYTTNYSTSTFSKEIKLNKLLQLEANPKYLEFPSVEIGNFLRKSVSFIATSSDVLVKNAIVDNPLYTITSRSDNLPKLLKVGERIDFTISYNPQDSGISFARLIVSSDVCITDTVFLTGGFPNVPPHLKTLRITQPSCDALSERVLVVGDSVDISWIGLLPKDVIQVESYFGEAGKMETIGKNVVGLNFKWLVPNRLTDSLRFSVDQYWPNNVGKTMTFRHDDEVKTAFFNALEDKIITSETKSRKAKIWNANTGELLHTFEGFGNSVNWAVFYSEPFSVADKYIALACEDSSAYLYNASDYSLIWQYKANHHYINSIEFSKDGQYAVLAINDGVIDVLDVKTGYKVASRKVDAMMCRYAQFHPVKQYEIMSITSYNGIIRFLDINLRQIDSIDVREGASIINSVYATYNWDGSKIGFVNHTRENAQIIDRNTKRIDFEVDHMQNTDSIFLINFVSFFHSNKEDYILTSGTDFSLRRWDAKNGSRSLDPHLFIEHTQTVNTGVFSSDGWRILSASADNTAKIWNLNQRILQSDTSCYFKIDVARAKVIDTIDFGDTYVDNISIKTAEKCIENLCNFGYNIRSIRIIGENPEDFHIIEEFNFPLKFKSKADLALNIYFQPQDADIRTAKIQIIIPNDTLHIVLIGKGVNVGILPLTTNIDFGNVPFDDMIDSLVQVAINVSDRDIVVDSFYIAGPQSNNFREFFQDEKFILYRNDTLSIPLRFFPVIEGKKNAVLYLAHNYHNFPMRWNLTGNGIELLSDTINLQINDIVAEIGQTVDFPLNLETITNDSSVSDSSIKIENILFSLTFNSSLLYPFTSSSEVQILNVHTSENYLKTIDISIPYKLGKQQIDGLKFLVTFGNDTVSSINLSNVSTMGKSRIFVRTNNAKFTMSNVCEADGTRFFDERGKLELYQNYPNPAIIESTIDFEIFENGLVSIRLYNLSGNLVKTLFDGYTIAGKHSILFFAKDYPAGTYYYILEIPTNKITKHLVIE